MLSVAKATLSPESGNCDTRVPYNNKKGKHVRTEDQGQWTDRPDGAPTSVPDSFPVSAMRWTLNGASGVGVSRNQVRTCT